MSNSNVKNSYEILQAQECFGMSRQFTDMPGNAGPLTYTLMLDTVDSTASFANYLGAGQIQLLAGDGNGCCYEIQAGSIALRTWETHLKIFNVTSGVEVCQGTTVAAYGTNVQGSEWVQPNVCCEVCITQDTVIEVQQFIEQGSPSGNAFINFGAGGINFGTTAGTLKIKKLRSL